MPVCRLARLAIFLLGSVVVFGCASMTQAPPEPIGLTGLPAQITVNEWPFWLDIPIESKDFDRTWKTVIDVVSERAAIGVLDKESGYVRTEWRPVDMAVTLYAPLNKSKARTIAKSVSGGPSRWTYFPIGMSTLNGRSWRSIASAPGAGPQALGRAAVQSGGVTSEQRYTFRVRPAESKIRMGIEARLMPSQQWATGLRNIPNAPWVGIHRELQDRLVIR